MEMERVMWGLAWMGSRVYHHQKTQFSRIAAHCFPCVFNDKALCFASYNLYWLLSKKYVLCESVRVLYNLRCLFEIERLQR